MFGIGGWEMLLIGVVALLVFGPKRLPELARTMGKGLAEFRRASSDLRRSIDLDMDPRTISAPKPETLPPAQAGAPAEPAATPDATPASVPTGSAETAPTPPPVSPPASPPEEEPAAVSEPGPKEPRGD